MRRLVYFLVSAIWPIVLFADQLCLNPSKYYMSGIRDFSQCAELVDWMSKFESDSIALVYSTAYATNPASAFGHLFILFQQDNTATYLNLSLSYSAEVEMNEHSSKYIFGGLGGAFNGIFSLAPFYAKIEEYVNFENRDLWIYELNLSSEQQYLFKLALYENAKTSKKYYFLNRNCAYKIDDIFKKIILGYNEVSAYKSKITPLYVLKKISREVGYKNVKVYPSLRKQYIHSKETVFDEQELFELTNNLNITDYKLKSTTFLKSKVLKNEYKYKYKKTNYSNNQDLLAEIALRKVSDIEIKYASPPVETENPVKSHADSRIEIWQNGNGNVGSSISYFSHEILDQVAGYNQGQQVIFLKLKYFEASKSFETVIANLESYNSFEDPDWPMSYKINLQIKDNIQMALSLGYSKTFDRMITFVFSQYEYAEFNHDLSLNFGALLYTQYVNLIAETFINKKIRAQFQIQKEITKQFSINMKYQQTHFDGNIDSLLSATGILYLD